MGLLAVGSVGIIDTGTATDDASAEGDADDTIATTEQVSADADPTVRQNMPDQGNTTEVGNNAAADAIPATNDDDILFGSDSADIMAGDAGDDSLHGEDGHDILNGDAGDDTLLGHNGDDTLRGGTGNDSLQGSDGDDVVDGDDGDDTVNGGLGDDTVIGGAGSDALFGGHGNDMVTGVTNDPEEDGVHDIDDSDYLNGGDGDDVIIAGNNDVVTAGNGEDTIVSGSWTIEGHAIAITDFDIDDDNLLLIYDDDADIPDVSIQLDPDNSDVTQVLMDGINVANVMNGAGISIEDIAIMPLSVAQSTGMAPL